MKEQNLYILIEKAMKKDKKAFESLYELKSREIIYLCIRELGNVQDGQDAAQEVFIHMYNSIARLRSAEAFNVWMNRIVVSTCNKMRRSGMKHEFAYTDDTFMEALPDSALDVLPQAFVESEEGRSLMVKLVDELPVKYRTCVLLHYYEKLSYAEIAKTLNISENAVDNNLRMARKYLKAELEKKTGKHAGLHSVASAVAFGPAMYAIFSKSAQDVVTAKMVAECATGWQAAAAKQAAAGVASVLKTALTALAITAVVSVAAIFVAIQFSSYPSSSPLGQEDPAGLPQGSQALSALGEDDVGTIAQAQPVLAGQVVLYRDGAFADTAWPGVTVEAVSYPNGTAAAQQAVSEEDGSFAFYDLPPGQYRIRVVLPQGMQLVTTQQENDDENVLHEDAVYRIEEGAAPLKLNILLNAACTVNGHVELPGGASGYDIFVRENIKMQLIDEEGNVVAQAAIDGQGNFVFENLMLEKTGEYTLRVADEAGKLGYVIADQIIYLYPGYGVG